MFTVSDRLTAFAAHLGLTNAFSFSSSEDTRQSAQQRELREAQNIHDLGAAYFVGLIDSEAPADKTKALQILGDFFKSYIRDSQIVAGLYVPITHNKSFEVFYKLQQSGFEPLSPDQVSQEISSDGILRNTLGVAMHDLRKYAGMDHIDCDHDQLRASGDTILANMSRYQRQLAIENRGPEAPKA